MTNLNASPARGSWVGKTQEEQRCNARPRGESHRERDAHIAATASGSHRVAAVSADVSASAVVVAAAAERVT